MRRRPHREWRQAFAPKSYVLQAEDGDLAGVVEPDGLVRVVDLTTRQEVLTPASRIDHGSPSGHASWPSAPPMSRSGERLSMGARSFGCRLGMHDSFCSVSTC